MHLLQPVTSPLLHESPHPWTQRARETKGASVREIHCSRYRRGVKVRKQRYTAYRCTGALTGAASIQTIRPGRRREIYRRTSRPCLASLYCCLSSRSVSFLRASSTAFPFPNSDVPWLEDLLASLVSVPLIGRRARGPFDLHPTLGYPWSESSRQFSVLPRPRQQGGFHVPRLSFSPGARGDFNSTARGEWVSASRYTVTNRGEVSVEVLGIGPVSVRLVASGTMLPTAIIFKTAFALVTMSLHGIRYAYSRPEGGPWRIKTRPRMRASPGYWASTTFRACLATK